MNIAVLDASTLGDDLNLSVFEEVGNVKIYPLTSADELESHTQDADIIVLNKVKINEETLPNPNKIKLICIAATGFDNVSLDYCKKHGIALCNVKGYSTNSVAQVTVAMALSLSCNLPQYNEFVKDRSYSKSGIQNRLTPVYHELFGKKWGLVGCGGIGSKVAQVAKALGCEICVCKKTPHAEYENKDIDSLMRDCDIISVHTPLNEETKNLINRQRIFSMKKNAIFINVARGGVADEEALADAIEEGAISGLGIDVYSVEPFPENHPYTRIMHLKNVCLTPHMAWGAYESRQRCMEEIVLNIKAFNNGEKRNRIV
ncbi:MAG: hydroxyacid dehydrogenase [Clostridia bacterium]|nr:hydroxyacid dehydrogenase [Clostridia bacterium]